MTADYSGITNAFTSFLKPIMIAMVALAVIMVILAIIRKTAFDKKMKRIAEGVDEITPETFFRIRDAGNDFVGVYVLYNKSKDMYYVGQSKNVYKRVNGHLNGKGNGDVYADYKYGDQFTIRMIPLVGSGYSSIDQLERHYIEYYSAYAKGYNKNRGNRS